MKKFFALIAFALLLTTAVSGCTGSQQEITSPKDAQTTLRNISSDVGNVEDTLAEIDRDLG